MALSSLADEYFRNMSPLASKIHTDINEAKLTYENVWNTLTAREKCDIINETLIKPELSLKYGVDETLDLDLNDLPCFRKDDLMSFFGKDHGRRLVTDESGSYLDEHSAPFLYHTKSQLNLCILKESRKKDITESINPELSELAMSHSKVVLELKNALKSNELLKNSKSSGGRQVQSPTGFMSKFIKLKSRDDDREKLVTPVMKSPSAESTFLSTFKSVLSPNPENKFEKVYTKSTSANEGSDENLRLLSRASRDSSGTEFQSCDDIESRTMSTDTLTSSIPKTGCDFLDNW